MSDNAAKRSAEDAAFIRALIYDPSPLSGPAVPTCPLDRGHRLRGGEFMGLDARREVPYLLTPLLDLALTDPAFRAIRRAIDNPTLRRLRAVEAALRSDQPKDEWHRAKEVADLLPFHQAALGCEDASARCAADALDTATMRIQAGDWGHAFLSFRAACLWASDAQMDATDMPYVGGPLRSRLHAFDQQAQAWLNGFRVTEHVVPRSAAVVYVPGNHDFWGHRWQSELARGRDAAAAAGITLLAEGEAVEMAGVRLVGASLWTDYEVGPIPRAAAMAACGDRLGGMRDHRRIKDRLPTGDTNAFRPAAALREHVAQRGRIERILATQFAGETVVVTHHAPHPASLRHGEWREATDAAYASDLSAILLGPHAPRLWLHGHVHRPIHHRVGETLVVANPRGIVTSFRDRRGIQRVETENPGFVPDLILET